MESYSFESFTSALSTTKTNAEYTMSEMLNRDLGYLSGWNLVNDNAYAWPVNEDGSVRCDNTPGKVGYLADRTEYTVDGLEFEFSVKCTSTIAIGGIMVFNYNEVHDGCDGYLVNIVSNGANQFVQCFVMDNCYSSSGAVICDYIGGWVYPENVNGATIHVKIAEGMMSFYFPGNDEAQGEFVYLDTDRGQHFEVPETAHFGILDWDGNGAPIDIKLSAIFSNDEVDSIAKVKEVVDEYKETVNFDNYSDQNVELINQAFAALEGSDDYNAIVSGLAQLKAAIKTLPSKYASNAIALADGIMASDNIVFAGLKPNVDAWAHEAGTSKITTVLGKSGWVLDKNTYTNFELTFSEDTSSTTFNPYGGIYESSVVFGASVQAEHPSCIDGFGIALYFNGASDCWLQVVKINMTETQYCGDVFIDGIQGDFANKTIKMVVNNGNLQIYIDDILQTGWFNGPKNALNLSGYNGGHIGIYDWCAVTARTFDFKAFKVLD